MTLAPRRGFVSWSGGKDSCLALYWALAQGWKVPYLLTMISQQDNRNGAHGMEATVLQAQAECLGLPMVQRQYARETYERELKAAITEFKKRRIGTVITGDIYLEGHVAWLDRVAGEMGIAAVRPLQGSPLPSLYREFVDAGFRAVVVSADAARLGRGWVGRWLDDSFARDVLATGKVDLMGELGEYHTLVVDGPLFHKRLDIGEAAPVLRDGHWSLDIRNYRVVDKG